MTLVSFTPARGDVLMGADYTFVDETAVNGVEYAYTLVDVDLNGTEKRHPEVRTVPNPPQPPVKLLSPACGATLVPREIPAFDWTPRTGRGQRVVLSTDPTFSDPSKTVRLGPGRRPFGRSVVPSTADGRVAPRPMPAHVPAIDGTLYWRVEQSEGRGEVVYSDTYAFLYADR